MPKLCQIAAMSILVACVVNAAPKEIPSNEVIQLSAIEVNHPFCQSETFIETGQETFTTIANDLPGRKEYNELIRIFHRGQWDKLEASMELFESEFEDSPLREAVAFLRVQSLFDRLENSNSPKIKEAEKSLRETLLLYPRSKLVPIIQATVGAFWLKNGMYAQSLALFTAARQEHPFHPLHCLFQFGIAENNYLLNEHDAAKKSFRAVTQKCNNPRLVTGAKLRLVELDFPKNQKEAGEGLERLYLSESNIITRFYPEALYNLGEFKFKRKEFKSSKFFFTEYLNSKKKDPKCAPYAMKRLGDIGIKTKSAIADISSSYLQTYDQYPKSDIGKYAYIQAMLIDYTGKAAAEQQRRTQVIDEKLETIQDVKIRHVAALSKGLALLDANEKGAVNYLVKVAKADPQELKNTEISQFISSRIFRIIKKESELAQSSGYQNENLKDEDLFQPVQEAYDLWLKGSFFEKATRELYAELVKTRFSELFEKQKWSRAFETIDQWKESGLWPEKNKLPIYSHSIGVKLTQKLMDIESEEKVTLFQSLIENEDTMSEFLEADFSPLFVSAYHQSNNQTELVAWLKKMKPNRRLAQSSLGVTQEMKDFLVFVQAEALMSVKRFSESEPLLKQITSKRYREMAIPMQVENYCGQKQFSQAVKFGLPQVQKLNTLPSKKRVLASLVSAINEGKLWKQSDLVLQQARKQGIKNKELAPFLYLAGKSQSEQKVCKKTIAYYSEALTLDSDHLAAQEAKFRLGKCYQKEKKKELAKKQWQAVVDSQDAFWAPLAKSEINLMEGP